MNGLIVPRDVFLLLCKTTAELSDSLLETAKAAIREGLSETSDIPGPLFQANVHVGTIQGILEAVLEENPGPPKTPTGGEECHVQ